MMEIEEEKQAYDHLLSDQIKWSIVDHKLQGHSNKQTALIVGERYNRPTLSHKTVKSIWEKYEAMETVENQWSDKGRPSTIEEADILRLERFFKRNPKKSVNEAKKALNIQASRETINRTVLDNGLKAYKAPTKILISNDNKRKRLEFAEKMCERPLSYWQRYIFSDEASFTLMNPNRRIFVRRGPGIDYREDQVQFKNQSESLMVWGAISAKGVGPLYRIDQIEEGEMTLNGERYLKLLQRMLLQYYPGLKAQKFSFQQDNAPAHRYGKVQEWFEYKQINHMKWPPQSPDLNLIECVWNEIKYRIKGETFSNKDELWRRLKKEWNKIDRDFIKDLYESMERRIWGVVDSNGGNTKY